MNMAKAIRGKFPTSFGVFSPTGHVVMAFPNDESAELDCEALLAGGFSENDVYSLHQGGRRHGVRDEQ